MKLKDFYEGLYRRGIVEVSTPLRILQEEEEVWDLVRGVARDEIAALTGRPLRIELPAQVGAVGALGKCVYELCRISQKFDEHEMRQLADEIEAVPTPEHTADIVMAHGFVAGITTLPGLVSDEKLRTQLQTVWLRLLSKSPVTQIVVLPELTEFPASWDWKFLSCLQRAKIFDALLLHQLVAVGSPLMRKEIGKLFGQWLEQEHEREFVLSVYRHFQVWQVDLPWQKMRDDLGGGEAFAGEGWHELFRPLLALWVVDRETAPDRRVLRDFDGDFLYWVQELSSRSDNSPAAVFSRK